MTSGVINIDSDRRFAFVAFLVALFVLIIAYQQTIFSIVNVWSHSNTYMHGFLIVPITVWLIWRNRERLYNAQITQQIYAVLPLCLVVLFWVAGKLVDAQIIMHVAFITLIPLLVWLFFGKHILYEIAFPLAYLYFAVPIGASIVPVLQDITAGFTVNALRLTGIPVFWEGHYIYIPSGSFEVAEACSGIRFLIASVALGVLYGYLYYHSLWRRMLFVLVSILVPIIANGIRAYGIVMIAHLSDYTLATGVDHIVYGWIFFSIVLILMFWIGSFFRDNNVVGRNNDANVIGVLSQEKGGKILRIIQSIIAISVLVAGPAAGYLRNAGEDKISLYDISLPTAQNGWEGPFKSIIAWSPKFIGVSRELAGVYRLNDKEVHIYLAYYYEQSQGNEMINDNNSIYGDSWHELRNTHIFNNDISMREIVVASGKERMTLRQWYLVDGESVVGPVLAKILEARSRLLSRYTGSYVVMLGADSTIDGNQANEAINSFITDMWPSIRKMLIQGNA